LQSLAADGLVQEGGGRYRLTPEGRAELATWLAAEREAIDAAAIAALYERFTALNAEFKELASSWQQRDGELNDHTDAAYDGAILDRLGALHERFLPLVQEIAVAAPRLRGYPARFAGAVDKVQAGDHAWFLRPIIDSYHTVWFELHEDLIGLAGLSREEEAVAGRAE
jgi:pyruvate,orthophosphate dikinase